MVHLESCLISTTLTQPIENPLLYSQAVPKSGEICDDKHCSKSLLFTQPRPKSKFWWELQKGESGSLTNHHHCKQANVWCNAYHGRFLHFYSQLVNIKGDSFLVESVLWIPDSSQDEPNHSFCCFLWQCCVSSFSFIVSQD